MEIGFILLWHAQIYASLSLMEVLGLDHLNASMKLWWPSLLGRFCPIVTTSVSQFFKPNTVWVTIGYMPHQPNQLPFLGKALKGFESYYL